MMSNDNIYVTTKIECPWPEKKPWDKKAIINGCCPDCGIRLTQRMPDGKHQICTRCDCWWDFINRELCKCKDEKGGYQKEYRRRANGIVPDMGV